MPDVTSEIDGIRIVLDGMAVAVCVGVGVLVDIGVLVRVSVGVTVRVGLSHVGVGVYVAVG